MGGLSLALTRTKALQFLAVFNLLFLLSACGESATVRYKLIAKANVGGEIVEAYAVNEFTMSISAYSLSGNASSASLTAEATILDMGERGSVYILQNVNNHPAAIVNAYEIAGSMGDLNAKNIKRFNSFSAMGRKDFLQNHRKRYNPYYFNNPPKMVAFKDENDPSTIYEITRKNFSQHFGANAKFIGLYIEPTDEPISNKIPERLKWWRNGKGALVKKKPGQAVLDHRAGIKTDFKYLVRHFEFKQ